MSRVSFDLNGRTVAADVDLDTPLLYVLRDNLATNNPRFGCGLGQCGACTVLLNGTAVRSCTMPVSSAVGQKIVTIEGLGTPDHPHPVQQAFIDEQALQCGYCANGWLMTAAALLNRSQAPTDAELHQALDGLICRCGSHASMLAAIRRAADAMKKGAHA